MRESLKGMEVALTSAKEESRLKEENMFEMGGRLYKLEMEMDARENEYGQKA